MVKISSIVILILSFKLRPLFRSKSIPLPTYPWCSEYVRERWIERTKSCPYENDLITREWIKIWLMLCANCYLAVMDFNMRHLLKHRARWDARNSNMQRDEPLCHRCRFSNTCKPATNMFSIFRNMIKLKYILIKSIRQVKEYRLFPFAIWQLTLKR